MSSSTEIYELIVQKIPEKREILGNKVILPSVYLPRITFIRKCLKNIVNQIFFPTHLHLN